MSDTLENTLFQKIQNSFDSAKKGNGGLYKDFLYFQKGKDYIVRLLPYMVNPENTIFHAKMHTWKSKVTDKRVEFIDPSLFGEPNPISNYSLKRWKELKAQGGNHKIEGSEMHTLITLFPKDQYLINCYVISDPSNPENEGTVKILKIGSQIHSIVTDHFSGERKDEFGIRIFDLTAKGCNLKIRCEENSDKKMSFPKYDRSYFMSPSSIDGVSDDPERIKEIHNQCHDLKTVYPLLPYNELKENFEKHWFGPDVKSSTVGEAKSNSKPNFSKSFDSLNTNSDEQKKEEEPAKPKEESKKETASNKTVSEDTDIDELLAGLD